MQNVSTLYTDGMDYKKSNMSTDKENNGRGNKRARVTRGSRIPKYGQRKHNIVHKTSKLK
jgi:hypothetical protein